MDLAKIIAREAIMPAVKVGSKKQLFQELAARAADVYGVKGRDVLEGLTQREKLGSTAMGRGIAIPHTRVAGLDRIVGVFARLERPVDFDAVDGERRALGVMHRIGLHDGVSQLVGQQRGIGLADIDDGPLLFGLGGGVPCHCLLYTSDAADE